MGGLFSWGGAGHADERPITATPLNLGHDDR